LCFFLCFLFFSWSAPLKLGWRKREESGGDDADARYKFRFRVWWRGELGFEALPSIPGWF
jgi:hypothetical protein